MKKMQKEWMNKQKGVDLIINLALYSHPLPRRSKPIHNQSLSKSENLPSQGRKRKKHESTTLAIRNPGESANMKVIILNKIYGMRKVKCLLILHYA